MENTLEASHLAEYGAPCEVSASAPGTVALLGEHVQVAHGGAIMMPLAQRVSVSIGQRRDTSLRFYSANLKERKRTGVPTLKYRREDRWANVAKGVLAYFLARGYRLRGMNVTISGDVPMGIGLGASTALAVAMASAMERLLRLPRGVVHVPSAALYAEERFIGGVANRAAAMAAFHACPDSLMWVDSSHWTTLPILPDSARFLLIDSRVPPDRPSRAEFERRRTVLEEFLPGGVGCALESTGSRALQREFAALPAEVRRLCLHAVGEHERAGLAVEALCQGDAEQLGRVITWSHESLRDLFELSCPEMDWLVRRSLEVPGVLGSRLTGPGGGGCVLSILEEKALAPYLHRLHDYETIFGFHAGALMVEHGCAAQVHENVKSG